MRRIRLIETFASLSDTAREVDLSASDRLTETNGHISGFSDGASPEPLFAAASGDTAWVWHRGRTFELRLPEPARRGRPGGHAEPEFRAPMPGRIVRLCVAEQEMVSRGTTLLILEAMKMEHEIKAPRSGRVTRFRGRAGDRVDSGAALLDFDAEDADV